MNTTNETPSALRAIATAESYPLHPPRRAELEQPPSRLRRRTGLLLGLLAATGLALIAAVADGATEQRVLNGSAIGTGFGLVGTALSGGCIPCGATVGLMVGAGVGHIYDLREASRRPSVIAWREAK